MKLILIVAALLAAEFARPQPLPDSAVADYIERRVAAGDYVGVIVGYFDETGTYVQSFGRVSRDSNVAPNRRTIFEISSVSKTFVATLLADAARGSEVSLHDPANDYLPQGVRLAASGERDIRLADLAAHLSGLPNRPVIPMPHETPNPYALFGEDDLLDAIDGLEPDSPPGSYRYSALGYAVLALALSNALDASFEDLIERRLTSPLGMTDTVFRLDAEQASRRAVGYTPDGDVAEPLDQGALRAAGSMYSTLDDLLIWARLHALRPDSELGQAARLTQEMRDEAGTIGLAWHRSEAYTDLSQYGTANGYRAYVGFLTDGSKGAVVLANTVANVQDIGLRLLTGHPIEEPRD